jgi:glycerophosphoryl diester phosphodiesterase
MMKMRIAALAVVMAGSIFGATRTEAIREKLVSGDRNYVFVAMHRGDWRNFPENSKGAILSSIRLGADIVELDVQMTKDGRFILNHDNTLNRTTTGKGKVCALTLEEIKQFKMRDKDGKPTDYDVLTLEEALELTRGKILVNIDKFTKHPKEILDAVAAVGALKEVVVKSLHAPDEARKLFGPYWKNVEKGELLYMPVVQFCWKQHKKAAHDLPLWLAEEPRKASMYEICVDAPEYAKRFGDVLKAKGAPRLWVNTMWDELDAGHGDKRALLDADRNWGWVLEQGATMLQSDYAAELIVYLMRKGRRNL